MSEMSGKLILSCGTLNRYLGIFTDIVKTYYSCLESPSRLKNLKKKNRHNSGLFIPVGDRKS